MENRIQKRIVAGLGLSACMVLATFMNVKKQSETVTDPIQTAIIQNDVETFKKFIKEGGDVHRVLPVIDGKTLTVAESVVHHERTAFIQIMKDQKKDFIKQDASKGFDVVTLAVAKNNPELLKAVLAEKPKLDLTYGKEGRNLLHIASIDCADKSLPLLQKSGKLKWDTKSKDGSTALTLASDKQCMGALKYFKENKADFKAKDGRGQSAMEILESKVQSKQDPAAAPTAAFIESMSEPKAASAPAVQEVDPRTLNFYKKRTFPKEKLVDRSELLEPEDRPIDAFETADNSEFSD